MSMLGVFYFCFMPDSKFRSEKCSLCETFAFISLAGSVFIFFCIN
jgi:hypothetical protein